MSVLIVMSGLPGSGKSAIANRVASELRIPILEMDTVFAPIFDRVAGDVLEWAPYEAFTVFADQNLASGIDVVLDTVCWTQRWRDDWRALAAKHGAAFKPIEVVCTDTTEHRRRLETRTNVSAGLIASWDEMQTARERFWEPWTDDRLVLDAVEPLDDLVARAVAYVRG